MNDNYFMTLANKEGKKALLENDYPAGCIIVKDNKIIAKASSRGKRDYAIAHAEIIAIGKACKKLNVKHLDNCVLYSNIEPCLMCAKAIVYSKIKKVVYGTNHEEYDKTKTFDILKQNKIGKDIEVISGLQKETAQKMLNEFFEKNKNIFK